MNNTPNLDDWRRQGQEKYLTGAKLVYKDYYLNRTTWNHDHCEFCGSKFSLNEGDLKKGYSTDDGYRWVCIECFDDFKTEFDWQL